MTFEEKQREFLMHYRQLMDGCIVQRVRYAPWCKMGRVGRWKRLNILEINRQGLFPLLYEYLPQMNIERYNKYYGLEEEPVVEGKYDSHGLRFEHD
jgi:hypothetical protein